MLNFSRKSVNVFLKLVLVCGVTLGMTACSANGKPNVHSEYNQAHTIPDPLEGLNRAILKFNTGVDIILIEPIAGAYKFIVPEVARDSVQNFMRNLRTPVYVANNVLQGDIGDAGVGTARFVVNTTFGIAGLFDVAKKHGLGFEQEDFGQTLATWGVGDGFYIVWPILGPSSLRDSVGMGVDTLADPVRIVAFSEDEEWIYYTRNAIEAVDNRSRLLETIRDTRENSLDYYSSLKSIYEQRRSALIRDSVYTNNYDIPSYEYDEYDEYDMYGEN